MEMNKHITIEKAILFLAASFAAYNFGLVGGYIEGTKFSVGGVIAGIVVNISLAIASSKFGSLNGKTRTRQATVAFVLMLILAPAIVAPVIFYSLPSTFLGVWWMRALYAVAYPLVADMAIVAMGAVSGKALISLSEPTAAQSEASAEGSAPSASAVRKNKKGSADAVRLECAALSAQYACTEPQCGWSPSVDALIASAGAGKSAKSAAASAKAGHAKNKHPKPIQIDQSLLIHRDGEK
jgi:hypothetical protein